MTHNKNAQSIINSKTVTPTCLQTVFNQILKKAEKIPQVLYRSYQLNDNKDVQGRPVNERWKYVAEGVSADLLDEVDSMFSTVCATNYRKNEGEVKRSDALYISDHAYFDFDGVDLDEVIQKVREFVGKLTDKGLNPDSLGIYASGGKGFHVMVPLSAFLLKGLSSLGVTDLATLHNLNKELAEKLYVNTLDLRIYTAGRMWRRPNVRRVAGTYKVPVTYAELLDMDASKYAEYVSAPREIEPPVEAELCGGLAILWANARRTVGELVKAKQESALRPKVELSPKVAERFKSAVWSIDPDADGYDVWFSVIAGTHHLYDGSDEGLALADAWSKQGAKYDELALRSTWEGLDDLVGSPITDGSIFRLARDRGWVDTAPHLNSNHDPVVNEEATPVHKTELGLAEYIMRKYADRLLYVMDLELWYFYDGKVWERDDDSYSLNHVIKEVGRNLRAAGDVQLYADLEAATESGDKDETRKAAAALKAHTAFYDKLESLRMITAVKELMKPEAKRVVHQALDSHPFLLNVQNGVLDLKTSELLPHDPSYLMTKITKVDYNAAADCPTFKKFMVGISMGRLDWIDYVQEALGYALTGDMSLQQSFWCVGGGGNGKSSLQNTILKMLGSYGANLPIEMFLVSRRTLAQSPDPQLMNIPGVRFVCTTEMAKGSQLDEAAFKNLISTDPLPARNLYAKKIAEIRPQFKVWPSFNDLPTVASTENAVWRRIVSIPFDADYEVRDVDKRILGMEDILKSELEGILAWCVDGYKRGLKKAGQGAFKLSPPELMVIHKEEYRDSLDIIKAFVDECLEADYKRTDVIGEIPATFLFDAYKNYCQRFNLPMMNNTRFGRDVSKYLTEKMRSRRGMVYLNWRVLDYWVTQDMRDLMSKRLEELGKAIYLTD